MSGPAFRIVCLCTGNRFRSPLAEALLAARLNGLPAFVASYGTADLPSGPAFPQAVRLGASLGVDLSTHRSRPLAGTELGSEDLVIGFELIHVAAAVVEAGAARERTFTLPELAGYLPLVGRPRGADAIEAAREAVRSTAELRKAEPRPLEEIPDPIGGPEGAYRDTANRISDLVAVVADGLYAPP
jgi:protein-tyrosine phosphatase